MYIHKQVHTLSKIFSLCKYLKVKAERCQLETWPTVWLCKTTEFSSRLPPPRNKAKLSQLQATLVTVSHIVLTILKDVVVVPIHLFWWYALYSHHRSAPSVFSWHCPRRSPPVPSCLFPEEPHTRSPGNSCGHSVGHHKVLCAPCRRAEVGFSSWVFHSSEAQLTLIQGIKDSLIYTLELWTKSLLFQPQKSKTSETTKNPNTHDQNQSYIKQFMVSRWQTVPE